MSSLPNTFTYGSVSSVYSVRDAFTSYHRSQYYHSSNVQTSDPTSDLSDYEPPLSESLDPLDSIDGSHAGVPEPERNFPTVAEAVHGRETTPLLRKVASFVVFSPPASATGYNSLDCPNDSDNVPHISTPTLSDSIVENSYDGKSTYGQTLFNCIAVLLGIGMLSEPLAFAYAGWFLGTTLVIFFGVTTCYTAKLLARAIIADPRLRSYVDIGRKAFGPKSSILTNILFCLELFSLSVVLVTLAADSLEGVWPAYSVNTYKVFSLFIFAPTVFMPLSVLSFTSLLGIMSTLLVIAVIFIDGFSKPDAPGSLRSPAPTSFSPGTVGEVGVALGLLMAGFAGHVVIPSLVRDMKDPSQFDHMANRAFFITTFIYAMIGHAGYLMFGNTVSDEISKDLLATPGYNSILNQSVMWLLVITPLTKFALSIRPLNIILEGILGLEVASPILVEGKRSNRRDHLFLALERIIVPIMSILVSILVPQFSALMAFMGAFFAFVICVIGPISAKIAMTGQCRWYDAALLIVSALMTVWGTFSAFWLT